MMMMMMITKTKIQ